MKLIIMTITCILLIGCVKGLDNDPFVDSSNNVKQAIPQGTEREPQTPNYNAVVIDVDTFQSYVEGEDVEIPVSFRILDPNLEFIGLDFGDMELILPGMEYIAQESKITYKVPSKIAERSVFQANRKIYITVVVEDKGVQESFTKEINFTFIKKVDDVPVIERVGNGDRIVLSEGTSKNEFNVYVRDASSTHAPNIIFFDNIGSTNRSLINQLRLGHNKATQVEGDLTLWKFTVSADLRVFNDIFHLYETSRTVQMIAYSSFGVSSEVFNFTFDVKNEPHLPVLIAEEIDMIRVNEQINFTFRLLDIHDRVAPEYSDENCMQDFSVEKMSCTCSDSEFRGADNNIIPVVICEVNWTPDKAGDFRFSVRGRSGQDNRLNNQVNFNREIRIQVVGEE